MEMEREAATRTFREMLEALAVAMVLRAFLGQGTVQSLSEL
jgi:hypothetical protein